MSDSLFARTVPEPNTGCWLWLGATTRGCYGAIRLNGRTVRANRLAWEMEHGPIPPGLHVLHRCDVPSCCNPAHLFLGTIQDNNADRHAKGRTACGAKHSQARISEDVAAVIKRLGLTTLNNKRVAALLGISPGIVGSILRGDNWKHVA